MSREDPAETTEAGQARQASRITFESLRERTDELELIISGISLLALLALPSWLFQHWLQLELHAEGQRHVLISLGFQTISGLSLTLACAFILHLAVRAYWVGLIGLKATFPDGIRWQAIRSIGKVARAYQRAHVVDLDKAIDSADRTASIVFALVSLVTLSVLWIGVALALTLLGAMGVSALLGASDDAAGRWGLHVFLVLTFISVVPSSLLDSDWLRRLIGPPGPRQRAVIEYLTGWQGLLFPQRLVLPVQLSLESNLPRWIFTAIFLLLVLATVLLGGLQERLVRRFAAVSSYDYFSDSDAEAGLRSAHYENLRGPHDALARVPLIPADMVADGHLRLFLPHLPNRDNPVLRRDCPQASEPATRRACLAALWQVQIDGHPAALADFVAAERRDLGMRGLQGYLSLAGLAPGRHELRVEWKARVMRGDGTAPAEPSAPAGADPVREAGSAAAERGVAQTGTPTVRQTAATEPAGADARPVVYRIPFWFSPPYQQDLAPGR